MAVAAAVTKQLSIPTIGIGAGPKTSGQVGLLHAVASQQPPVKTWDGVLHASCVLFSCSSFKQYAISTHALTTHQRLCQAAVTADTCRGN